MRNKKAAIYVSSYSEFCNASSVSPRADLEIWQNLVLAGYCSTLWFDGHIESLTEDFPLVDWDYYAEVYGKYQSFTTLHHIVCGVSRLSLVTELQGSNDINKLDKDGRSALWYAAIHRRLDDVRILLEHGADPNIGDPPIKVAAGKLADYEITKALLDSGATLGPSSDDGWRPWPDFDIIFDFEGLFPGHHTGDEGAYDRLRVDQLLIRRGIDINCRGSLGSLKGVTMLMHLVRNSESDLHSARLKQLVQLKADLEITDEEDMTAIMIAIQRKNTWAVEILARAGARVDLKNVTGSTVLHLTVATTVSCYHLELINLCKAMQNMDLTKVDVDAKNEDGHTAYDLLNIRYGPNWFAYCESKKISTLFYGFGVEHEPTNVRALESLLHHVQEIQGVPEADRYPPLGEYGSRDPDEQVIPGAWPGY